MISIRLYRSILLSVLAGLLIYFGKPIIMPIIFSALIAMFIHPWVKKLEKIGLNLQLSSLIVVVFTGVVMLGTFSLITYEGVRIVSNLPKDNIENVTEDPVGQIDQHVLIDLGEYSEEIQLLMESFKKKTLDLIPMVLDNINDTIAFMVTCPIYIFFMLVSRSSIRKFYYRSFDTKNRKLANRILRQIEQVYMNYLRGMLLVITIVSLLTGLGLYILGIQHAFFLGAISGLLTIIPYVGVFISAFIPTLIAFLTKDSYWYVVGVIGVYTLVQFLEGNIITPKIMGNQVGVNSIMIILGIVIFGSIGGIIGMLLTVPILALIKTVAFYIPGWKPLRYLLQVS